MRTVCLGVAASVAVAAASTPAVAQRVLGLDVSAWQGGISQSNWNTAYGTGNRKFVFMRSSRGGTTGYYNQSDPDNINGLNTFSQRYDDPYFIQNINRATTAGLMAGPYHFSRPDIIASTQNSGGIANTGTDEADHFIQMAGPWMRPGYLLPVHDFEAGDGIRTDNQLAQFCEDFSNRIYAIMQIRPAIYTNGNYAANILGQATNPTTAEIVADYPTLWSARWPQGSGQPYTGNIQTEQPKDTYTPIYGPWDDTGITHPWVFWQYSSGETISGISDPTVDGDVAQGDIEFVKDRLVPAVWWNDNSGDWSTLANWNSGQTPVQPVAGPGQVAPVATGPLPTARLPGAAGSGITSGQHDTVILDRPSANITLTISTGSHNIRKMYMRETLNITGGTLTINYDPKYYKIADPDYETNPDYPSSLHSGPISAQFSGNVTLSGTGSLSVHTLQVDATQTLTLAGSTGSLTFNTINLMPHSTTPAKIAITGSVTINPLSHSNPYQTLTATIANGAGSGSTGFVDLSGGTRAITVGNGSADVDLDVAVPITNGGLTKNGTGTMRLSGNNTFSGAVTVNGGVLRYNHSSGLTSSTLVTVNNGGTLDMNGITDTISALASAAGNTTGTVTQGTAGLTLSAASGTFDFGGTITSTGTLTKSGAATQIFSGNNSLGPVNITAGKLLFNGTNATGNVTVGTNGVLGGTGSVSGAVTVNSTGHVSPGASIESLGVGALTLNAGSVLDFELGTGGVMDLINVTGLLKIVGGSVNLTDLGGMAYGTYMLIDYGTINGSVASLGTPAGPGGFNYRLIDTGSAINLQVFIPGDFNIDGKVDGADYVVWRKGLGTTYTQTDYDVWRARFGDVAGSGAGFGADAAIPEPATAVMLLCGLLPFIGRRRHRS